MEILQSYETTVSDARGDWALTCLVIPKRSMAVHDVSGEAQQVSNSLGLKLCEKVGPTLLPSALASLLVARKSGKDALQAYKAVVSGTASAEMKAALEPAMAFAEQASFLDLIPFEESPLEPTALATLLTKAGGVGVGAFAGWVIAGTSTPLLLLTLPAGMIICGAAAGVATGLEEGFRKRISSWLAGKTEATEASQPKKPIFSPKHSPTAEVGYLRASELPVGIDDPENAGWDSTPARERFKINWDEDQPRPRKAARKKKSSKT